MEVFLGGTTAEGTTWREDLIPMLEIDYFNPIVDDWNDEAYELELEKRETCDFIVYAISPLMEGVYSIAEAVDDSNKRPEQTFFLVLEVDGEEEEYTDKMFSKAQLKSLDAVKKMITKNGSFVVDSLDDLAQILNTI